MPPTNNPVAPQLLQLAVERQQDDYWCWAAVAVALARYYGSDDPTFESQCKLASSIFQADCCGDKTRGEQALNLSTVIEPLGCENRARRPHTRPPSFDDLVTQIRQGAPMPVLFVFSSGDGAQPTVTGGHLFLLSGVRSGNAGPEVYKQDPHPLFPSGWFSYEAVQKQCGPYAGDWTWTFWLFGR